MTTKEALAVAKQYKNHFGAFAHIEEVLVQVAAAKNTVGELTKQRDILAGEVAGLKQESTRATARVKKRLASEEETEVGMQARAKDVQARLDAETQTAKEASKKAIAELKAKYLAEESKLKISIDALTSVEKDLRERTDKLEKIYSTAKDKVSKL